MFWQRSPVEAEHPVTSVGLRGGVFFIVFKLDGHWLCPGFVPPPDARPGRWDSA